MSEYRNTAGEIVSEEEFFAEAEREALERGEKIVFTEKREDPSVVAARIRGYRGGCLKRLQKHFKLYESFDSGTAADCTGIEESELKIYLSREAAMEGTRIVFVGEGMYQIVSRFL